MKQQVTRWIKQMFPEQRELAQHLALGEGWRACMPSDITGCSSFENLKKTYFIGSGEIQRASLVAQTIKNWSAMQETGVWSLSQEDPLEKGMATHCSIPAWRIPWTEEPGGLQSMGSQRVWTWLTKIFTFTEEFKFVTTYFIPVLRMKIFKIVIFSEMGI